MPFADERDARLHIERFFGLDQSRDDDETPTDRVRDSVNCLCVGGELRRMAGCAPLHDLSAYGRVLSLAALHRRAQPARTYLLAGVCNAQGDCDLLAWDGVLWRSIRGTRTLQDARFSHINYQSGQDDIIILANGRDDLLRWDGTGDVAPLSYTDEQTHAPRAASLALHHERVWAAGVSDAPDSVYYSDDLQPENWLSATDAAGQILFSTWDGDRVRAVHSLLGDVAVFRERSVWRVVGTFPDEFVRTQVYATRGAIAPRSVAAHNAYAYFLSREGLMRYNGLSAEPYLAGELGELWRGVSPNAAADACAAVWGDMLYLALPTNGALRNNALLQIDLRTNAPALRRGVQIDALLALGDTLYCAVDGRICALEQGDTHPDGPIAMHWQLPCRHLGTLGTRKHARKLQVLGTGQLRATLLCDGAPAASAQADLGDQPRIAVLALRGTGRRLGLQLENIDGGDLRIQALTLLYEEGDS